MRQGNYIMVTMNKGEFIMKFAQGERVFHDVLFPDNCFQDLNLSGVDFAGCSFMNLCVKKQNLSGINLSNATIYDGDMADCNIRGGNFSNSSIHARFTGCNLEDANFSCASFHDGYIRKCILSNADLRLVSFNGTWVGDIQYTKPLKKGYSISYTQGGATSEEVDTSRKRLFRYLGIPENILHFEAVIETAGEKILCLSADYDYIDFTAYLRSKDGYKEIDGGQLDIGDDIEDVPSAVCAVMDLMDWRSWGAFKISDLTADDIQEGLC